VSRRLIHTVCAALFVSTALASGLAAPAHAQVIVDDLAQMPMNGIGAHVVDEAGGRVYLSAGADDDRVVVTSLVGDVVHVIDDLPGTGAIALSGDGSDLFVALDDFRVAEVDTSTWQVTRTLATPASSRVDDLEWTPGALWLATDRASTLSDSVDRLDLASGDVASVGPSIFLPELTAAAGHVVAYEGTNGGKLVSIKASTREVQATRTGVAASLGFGATPSGTIYTATDPLDAPLTIQEMQPADLSTLRTVPTEVSGIVRSAVLAGDLGVSISSSAAAWVDVFDAATSEGITSFQLPIDGPSGYRIDSVVLTSRSILMLAVRHGVTMASTPTPVEKSSVIALDERNTSAGTVGVETTLSGSLTENGQPIVGAELVVTDVPRDFEAAERTRTVVTDEAGRFSFPYTPRSYEDVVQAVYRGGGTHAGASGHFRVWFDFAPVELSVDGPHHVSPGETPTITGMLTSQGAPLSGEEIEVDPTCDWGTADTVTTEADGSFSVVAHPGRCEIADYVFRLPYTSVHESAEATSRVTVSWSHSSLTVAASPSNVTVGSPLTWSGQLMIEGVPAPDATVYWTIRDQTPGEESGTLTTDRDGEFEVTRTYETVGRRTLTVDFPDTADALGDRESSDASVIWRTARIEMDDAVTDAHPGDELAFSGVLESSEDQPLPGRELSVTLNGVKVGEVLTDAGGAFSFSRVVASSISPPYDRVDSYRFSFPGDGTWSPANISRDVVVSRAPTSLSVSAMPDQSLPGQPVEVSGLLVNGDAGPPVVGAHVVVEVSSNGFFVDSQEVVTDSEGQFDLTVVSVSGFTHMVTATYAGDPSRLADSATTSWSSSHLPGTISLDGPHTVFKGDQIELTGRIADEMGVGDQTTLDMIIRDEEGVPRPGWSRSVRSDQNGNFSVWVNGKQLGRWTVEVTSQAWRTAPQTITHRVRVIPVDLQTRALRPDARSGGFAVYDADAEPRLATVVDPATKGICLKYFMERRIHGEWVYVGRSLCRNTDSRGRTTYALRIPHHAGERYRVRPAFSPGFNIVGEWVKVRFR
jgi:hypothetical protein